MGLDRREFLKHAGTALATVASWSAWSAFAAAGDKAKPYEVEMVTTGANYFDPVGLWVPSGAAVRFVIKSGTHSASAYHPDNFGKPLRIPEKAKPFDSGMIGAPGQGYEYTFEVPGVYDYFCLPHEAMGMVGRIVVGEAKDGPGTKPLQASIFPMAKQIFEKIPPERILKDKKILFKDR